MNATGSKIDLDLPFTLKILRIKLNLMVLLLALYFDQERITKIVIMQVKRCFIVPSVIRCDGLPIRNSRILD